MLLERIVRIVYISVLKISDESMKFDEQPSKESFNLASK